MKCGLYIFCFVGCMGTSIASANWQYGGVYARDGLYSDDGARVTVSVRGGGVWGRAKIKNAVGSVVSEYYTDGNEIVSAQWYDACVESGGCTPSDWVSAGRTSLGNVPVKDNFSSLSFTAGGSIGFVMANRPQWRLEAGYDYFSESDYNVSPLFNGNVDTSLGYNIEIESAAIQSTISTDMYSFMAFYDFFNGNIKPLKTFVPYVGFGIGYATTNVVMNLSDPWGDLSTSVDLQNFGEPDDYGVLQFYKSKTASNNIAGILAVGLSYGIADNVFLDGGVRLSYIPKIKWELTSSDSSRNMDWLSGDGLIYTNVTLGLRFEF